MFQKGYGNEKKDLYCVDGGVYRPARRQQLADDIIKEDLYTAYYAVSGKEEIVADRDVEIPGMEEDMLVERTAGAVVESERNVVVMNQPANSHNDGNGQEEQINVAEI